MLRYYIIEGKDLGSFSTNMNNLLYDALRNIEFTDESGGSENNVLPFKSAQPNSANHLTRIFVSCKRVRALITNSTQ